MERAHGRTWERSSTIDGRPATSLGLVVVVLATWGLALTSFAVSLTFAVTSVNDEADETPGDGFCETASCECTLRAATQEASALGQSTRIVLATNETYALSLAGAGEDLGATGDLDTSGSISLIGNG